MGVSEFWASASAVVVGSVVAAVGATVAVGLVRGMLVRVFSRGL